MEIEEVARVTKQDDRHRHPSNNGSFKRTQAEVAALFTAEDGETARAWVMGAIENATRWTKVDAKEWREVIDWEIRARYGVKVAEWVAGKPRESVEITTANAHDGDQRAMTTADMLLRIAAQPELASRILDTMAERARQVAPSPGSPRSSPKASESTPVSPASPTSPDSTSNHGPNAPESGPT